MLQVYVLNVSAVLNVCCKCIYLNVAYVALAIHVCCKCMLQVFYLDVAYVAVLIHMLQAYVVNALGPALREGQAVQPPGAHRAGGPKTI
jgi:hypothetical protein